MSFHQKLQNLFILPSMSSLRKLSRYSNVECCDIDMEYLRSHSSNLSESEKIVVLLIDGVYRPKIEYRNGKFVGFTDEGDLAKTVLTFMIQSTC